MLTGLLLNHTDDKTMPIDYKRYPKNWKTEIRPAVLKRAGNKCEFCGLSNGQKVYHARVNGRMEWFRDVNDIYKLGLPEPLADFWANKPVTVVLTIAHLDHDECNHDIKLDRLAALCQLCHLRYDAKEKYRRIMSYNHK